MYNVYTNLISASTHEAVSYLYTCASCQIVPLLGKPSAATRKIFYLSSKSININYNTVTRLIWLNRQLTLISDCVNKQPSNKQYNKHCY